MPFCSSLLPRPQASVTNTSKAIVKSVFFIKDSLPYKISAKKHFGLELVQAQSVSFRLGFANFKPVNTYDNWHEGLDCANINANRSFL